ncbi:MAG TPA: thiol reductase thioredoxin, partial [Lactobacillus sp.]|nr:thiol reductase thioredoxin [Lactobacillus sp.]
MSVKPINDQNFNQETDSGTVVIDFNATWCPPCKMM